MTSKIPICLGSFPPCKLNPSETLGTLEKYYLMSRNSISSAEALETADTSPFPLSAARHSQVGNELTCASHRHHSGPDNHAWSTSYPSVLTKSSQGGK